tara:strand:+ start:592 stop:1503 length:912 start_codon:yes stop_codon:yes gene_type:complete
MATAREIYQDLLAQLTHAVLGRDAAGFAALARLPFVMKTMDGCTTHRSTQSIMESVTSYRDMLSDQGIDGYLRSCDTAKFISPQQISGYHTTRLRRGDVDAAAPYLTRMSLFREDDVWKVGISDSSLHTADWPLLRQEEFDAPAQDRSEAKNRLQNFQTILDRISAAFVGNDVQGWLNCVSLPLHLVTRQGVESFETADQIIADFDAYQRDFKTHGVTAMIRQAKTAEIIGGDQMTGTYRMHMMRGTNHVVPPWDASMTLRKENGLWRVTTVMRALGHLNWSALSAADMENTPDYTPEKGDQK